MLALKKGSIVGAIRYQRLLSTLRANPKVEALAKLVSKELPNGASSTLGDVIRTVWSNAVVTSQCPDLIIRLTTLRGTVSAHIWKSLGHDPAEIQLLAVGSTDQPHHLPNYSAFIRGFYQRTAQMTADYARGEDVEIGYDLLSVGSSQARLELLQMFNQHYGAPQDVLKKFAENSALVCGGMRGLKDLADGQMLRAQKDGTFCRFIQPDNSFGTWWNIVEQKSAMVQSKATDRREVCVIGTEAKHGFHVTRDDVDRHYAKHSAHSHEMWYITPVGNPSGTCMPGEDALSHVISRIHTHNPRAIIVVDGVYIRTLTAQRAQKFMRQLWSSQLREPLQRVVFLDSLSKSHGLCRERLGIYFCTDPTLFTEIHTANIGFSAGPGQIKDWQILSVARSSAQEQQGISELHHFWRDERRGLVSYLTQDKFSHLFDAREQVHLAREDLEQPCTLYVMLKTRPGVNSRMVFEETGALGVDQQLSAGHYIRYAVGMMREPHFSQYVKKD